jgi:ribosomal protein S18 acetylase RimI-like enzyme
MDFHLRPATPDDDTFLAELFYDVRSPEFAALPAAVAGPLLQMQHRAQLRAYAETYPSAVNQIVWMEGRRAGRLLVSHTPQELHLVDIALLSQFRGQGVGTRLLSELCRNAREHQLPLRLSVQVGNPAWRLYERLGFAPVGSDGVYISMELGAAAAVATQPPGEAAEPETGADTADRLTQGYFQSLQGRTLKVRTLGGVQTALTVANVEPLRLARNSAIEWGDSFRVQFTGPMESIVSPETVEIIVDGHAPLALFVSPLGPLEGRMQYEAIFNRSRVREGAG